MTIKLIAILLLAGLVIGLLVLYRRPERRSPRLGASSREGANDDTSAMLITPAMLASEGGRPHQAAHHDSPSHHSSHHGADGGGADGGSADGGGGGAGSD